MSGKCAWFISLPDGEALGKAAAASIGTYGLPVKGQRWPVGEKLGWLVSAQEAFAAGAAVVVVLGSRTHYMNPDIRRGLAMFRLALQSLRGGPVNGFLFIPDAGDGGLALADRLGVLDDFELVDPARWQARAVARAHAPQAPAWPLRLGLYGHERLGVWLETHPAPQTGCQGALAGVSGNESSISFHAVGAAGGLPDRTVVQFELKGLTFDSAGMAFQAWGLQNPLPASDSYYVRLEGEPDWVAAGALPEGNAEDVHIMRLA